MMRKQKFIKILLAAGILSARMSMISFAEEGWVNENDKWAYYTENGERVTSRLLELDGDYYYVDENGYRVSNQWVAIDNELAGEEGEPEQYWYYFQQTGKAYKYPENASSDSVKIKKINGKKYAFDSEGRMLYGWVSGGERLKEEDAWMDADYYFGTENDGAMKFGWQKIPILANVEDEVLSYEGIWEDLDEEEERKQDRWFYFSAGGRKTKGTPEKIKLLTIDGHRHGFDQYGRMISSWYADHNIITTEAYDKNNTDEENLTQRQGGSEYTREFMYFGAPESGIQYKNSWFKAVPSRFLMESKHMEGAEYTYYVGEDGHLYANEIRVINGERYAFDNYGRQIRGLVCLVMTDENETSEFEATWYQDKKEREFYSVDAFNELIDYERFNSKGALVECYRNDFASGKLRFYYFGGKNGEMLTGKHEITLGENEMGEKEVVEFVFEDSGRYPGKGIFGRRDNKLYQAGMLLKASDEENYAIVRVENKTQTVGTSDKTYKMLDIISRDEFIEEVCNSGIFDEKKDEEVWTVRYEPENTDYYLVDQNGAIVKNRDHATDGEGYRFKVKNSKIQSIAFKEQ